MQWSLSFAHCPCQDNMGGEQNSVENAMGEKTRFLKTYLFAITSSLLKLFTCLFFAKLKLYITDIPDKFQPVFIILRSHVFTPQNVPYRRTR